MLFEGPDRVQVHESQRLFLVTHAVLWCFVMDCVSKGRWVGCRLQDFKYRRCKPILVQAALGRHLPECGRACDQVRGFGSVMQSRQEVGIVLRTWRGLVCLDSKPSAREYQDGADAVHGVRYSGKHEAFQPVQCTSKISFFTH